DLALRAFCHVPRGADELGQLGGILRQLVGPEDHQRQYDQQQELPTVGHRSPYSEPCRVTVSVRSSPSAPRSRSSTSSPTEWLRSTITRWLPCWISSPSTARMMSPGR